MTIELDTPKSGTPRADLRNPGASVIVGIANVSEYDQRTIDGDPVTWDDGTPRKGKVVTGIVISATDTTLGKDGPELAPGDTCTFWCEKGRWFTWTNAVKEHGTVHPGDVMQWQRLDDEPAKVKGYSAQKVYKATIRAPKASDGDLADRCATLYHELAKRPALDARQAHEAPAPMVDEAPF